ncbi:hypothetical protein KUV47_02060 [Vannielia litorea]|uniref:hypothetical protein n=1 Tax=Vannielia litorea TaxID=1217970 RepID=UPI001C94A7AC|nr:hypothetical protein [Vannielia litorea]MBY6151983.1 hypothetical protein [Vannielia litorea]
MWRRLASAVGRRLGAADQAAPEAEVAESAAPKAATPEAPAPAPEAANGEAAFAPLLTLMAEACAAYPADLRKEGFGDLATRFAACFEEASWVPAEPQALDERAAARALLGPDGLALHGDDLPAGATWASLAESRRQSEARVLSGAKDQTRLTGFELPGAARATLMHRDTDSWNALIAVEIVLQDGPVPDVAALARDPQLAGFSHLTCTSGEDLTPMGLYVHALAPRPTANWPHTGLAIGLRHPEVPEHQQEAFAACPAGLILFQLTEPRDDA